MLLKSEIVTVSILATMLIVMLFFTDANAVTSDELKDLKEKIQMQKQKNLDMMKKVIEHRESINMLYDTALKKSQERAGIKSGLATDWSNYDRLESIDLEIAALNTHIQELRHDYTELKQEKQSEFKKLNQLKAKLQKDQNQYYQQKQKTLNGLYKVIGVQLDSTCNTLIQNNINNGTCPTYDDLIQLDSSLRMFSGDFVTVDGITQRDNAQFKNSWRYYDFDNEFRIIVDPPSGMAERIKTITISPNFDTYYFSNNMIQRADYELVDIQVNNTYSWIKTNKTIDATIRNQTQSQGLILFHDRFVNDSCSKAIINAAKTKHLLPDTIHYMRTGCDDNHTSFVTKEIIPLNSTVQDITTTQKYKHEQWLKYIKEYCIFKFHSCEQ